MRAKKFNRFVTNFLFIIVIMITSNNQAQERNNWVPKNYTITGIWNFSIKSNVKYLVFGEDFKTNRGPDVKVYLSKKRIEDIDKRESVDEGGVFLGEIKFSGSQEFKIPESINLKEYKSIVVHCQKYSAVWGGSNID
ncbi:Electron transfer DM13 [Tenacibaculum sp. MAR_2009_124]|uniref:DM13 domain-containing protein n=1 Tax=Tenacibaculum sp. MAR_2009_124 TaxID=1250059 RepID=UPI000894AF67|nr:DM13 domain-containing protein [Tenacibaculum sp. MAR_2009_124]SEC94698.1 Electron transfer DM13 [Tenacibaculum sp. MAR_2009_124]